MRIKIAVAACALVLAGCSSGGNGAAKSASPTAIESTSSAQTSTPPVDPGEAAAETATGEAPTEQEGSVTTTDGAFVKYYDGLQLRPTKVTISTPGPSQDPGTQTVLVTIHIENLGTAPVQLDNAYAGQFNVDMTYGENRYDAQGYAGGDGEGITALPARLVPGTSADLVQEFEVPEGKADVLRLKISPNPMLYDFYTFTDVETLIV